MTILSQHADIPGARGYHCARFDTDLVQQIIDMEVESVAERLEREGEWVVDAVTRHRWKEELREVLVHTALEQATEHTFLPAEFRGCLQRTLEDFVDVDRPVLQGKDPADHSLRCLLGHLQECCNPFGSRNPPA